MIPKDFKLTIKSFALDDNCILKDTNVDHHQSVKQQLLVRMNEIQSTSEFKERYVEAIRKLMVESLNTVIDRFKILPESMIIDSINMVIVDKLMSS